MHSRNFKIHKQRPVLLPPKQQLAATKLSPNKLQASRSAVSEGWAGAVAAKGEGHYCIPEESKTAPRCGAWH
jgi:hypothetical protein